jgi:hypothetical protein
MNKTKNSLSPSRRQLILWLAQINSVVVLTVLAWVLPGFAAVEPVPRVQQPLLIAALVSLPLALLIGRWLMNRARGDGENRADPIARATAAKRSAGSLHAESDAGREIGLSVIAWAVCELPMVLGFVYALLGGERLYAVVLGAASLLLLLLLRPDFAS